MGLRLGHSLWGSMVRGLQAVPVNSPSSPAGAIGNDKLAHSYYFFLFNPKELKRFGKWTSQALVNPVSSSDSNIVDAKLRFLALYFYLNVQSAYTATSTNVALSFSNRRGHGLLKQKQKH